VRSYRRTLVSLWVSRRAFVLVPVTISAELLNLLANLSVGFAGLMAPLALVSIVTGLHPFFLLAYGIVLTVLFPAFSREHLSRRHLLHKLVGMGIICGGIIVTFRD